MDCGTPARDGSAVEVWVTEAGRRLLEHTDDRLSTYVSALTIGLWPADQRSLGEMLQQILDADVPTL